MNNFLLESLRNQAYLEAYYKRFEKNHSNKQFS